MNIRTIWEREGGNSKEGRDRKQSDKRIVVASLSRLDCMKKKKEFK